VRTGAITAAGLATAVFTKVGFAAEARVAAFMPAVFMATARLAAALATAFSFALFAAVAAGDYAFVIIKSHDSSSLIFYVSKGRGEDIGLYVCSYVNAWARSVLYMLICQRMGEIGFMYAHM
jgi:hypothetical protein